MKKNDPPPIPKKTLEKKCSDSKNPKQPDNPGEGLFSSEDWLFLADCFHLTTRETAVATLLFEGRTRYQIARHLQCAEGTVRVYIDRLFKKLNVQDRVGLVLRLVRVHLDKEEDK